MYIIEYRGYDEIHQLAKRITKKAAEQFVKDMDICSIQIPASTPVNELNY